jgi:mRNA interferase ChpB
VIPARGDILHLAFDPASGRELKGDHYCLVVSAKAFNKRFKLAMVCPISSGLAPLAREAGFLVSMMGTGSRLHGSVHCHQVKTLDWEARKATFFEKAPPLVIKEVVDCLIAVLEDD